MESTLMPLAAVTWWVRTGGTPPLRPKPSQHSDGWGIAALRI